MIIIIIIIIIIVTTIVIIIIIIINVETPKCFGRDVQLMVLLMNYFARGCLSHHFILCFPGYEFFFHKLHSTY